MEEVFADLASQPEEINPKGILQEKLQSITPNAPEYELLSQTGPEHSKRFACRVMWNGQELGRGEGLSKKEAQVAAVWSFLLVQSIDLGEFSPLRNIMLLAIVAGAILSWIYVPEFLAVRALGMILLLAAEPLLESAVLRHEPSRLLLVVLAYAWVIAGLFFVGMPYVLRDAVQWVTSVRNRLQAGAVAGTVYGLALVVCALFFW
jgi:hypothetical protein